MNTLNFTDADLKVNREGRLSEAQRKIFEVYVKELKSRARYRYKVIAALMALVAAGGLVTLYQSPDADLNKMFPSTYISTSIGVVLGCALGFCLIVLFEEFNLWSYARGRVYRARAKAHIKKSLEHIGDPPVCTLIMRSGLLKVGTVYIRNPEVLKQFEHGKYYRIYYLYNKHPQIVSVEEELPDLNKPVRRGRDKVKEEHII